jgi:hypothetical protein
LLAIYLMAKQARQNETFSMDFIPAGVGKYF